jgi:NADPH-dependent 2,4-dienoyl-CoA reductase/sulfur reductase-like enzyme
MGLTCDVLVVGGGCGGVAAALAATDLGRSVILTEVGSWVGGQLTSQAVPPDEHPWVESTGTTARYRRLRDSVRAGTDRSQYPCPAVLGCRSIR